MVQEVKYSKSLLEAIGNTPLVKINSQELTLNTDVYAKYEALNPGGSIKSRTAYWMVKQALQRGEIDKNTILLEASSGNQGIGLSMVGAIMGFRVKIIMPENMSKERKILMNAYGAEVILSPAYQNIGQTIQKALKMAKKISEENDNIYWINQFANRDNIDVHRRFTAQEILKQIPQSIDAFVAGIGTGGTITGIGEVLKRKYPDCKIIAVEPENAAFLQGGFLGNHIQEGIGDGIIPDILNTDIIDNYVAISDKQALAAARQLAHKEGLFVGISSGSNIYAVSRVIKGYPDARCIVTILPDSGDRYFSSGLIED